MSLWQVPIGRHCERIDDNPKAGCRRRLNTAVLLIQLVLCGVAYAERPMYNCVTPSGAIKLRVDAGAISDSRCTLFAQTSLDETTNTTCTDKKCTIKVIKREEGFVVHGTLNGSSIRLLIDTGATSTILSPILARVVGLDYETHSTKVRLRTAGGFADAVMVKGVQIGVANLRPISIPVVIAPNMTDSFLLLGQDYLRHVSVVIKGSVMELTINKK